MESSFALAASAGFVLGASLVAIKRQRRKRYQSFSDGPAPHVIIEGRRRRPRHVAFIMDGNRRYGEREFGTARRLEGHQAGGNKLGQVVEWCIESGVSEVTCFAFSTENWNRDAIEIECIMNTFVERCEDIKSKAHEKGVRVRVLCTDSSRFPSRVERALSDLVTETHKYATLTLNLAVSYGARSEIVDAARRVAQASKDGLLDPDSLDECSFAAFLQLPNEPDLLIRTSGEQRLSNFLLWQLAYTELVFLDKFWPDLERTDFDRCLDIFASRHRRFGS